MVITMDIGMVIMTVLLETTIITIVTMEQIPTIMDIGIQNPGTQRLMLLRELSVISMRHMLRAEVEPLLTN